MAKKVLYEDLNHFNPRKFTVAFFIQELSSVFSPYFQISSPYVDTSSTASQPFCCSCARAKMSSKRMFAVGASVLIHFVTPVH